MAKLIDETGNVYGDLTVLSRGENHINPSGKIRVQWNCICSCGNKITVLGESLRNGRTKSCGQCGRNIKNREIASDKICQEMIGKTFNHLEVIKPGGYETDSNGKRRRKVFCKCLLCNQIVEIRANWIKNGTIGSCGNHNKSSGELYVKEFLNKYHIDFQEEFSFEDLIDKKPLRFDFVLLVNKKPIACIEVQGNQHYNINNGWYNLNTINHDKAKIDYCNKYNLPLLILDYSGGQQKTDFTLWDKQILNIIKGKEYEL